MSETVNLLKLTPQEIDKIRRARWRCRYDLLYLLNVVLGKDLVSEEFNGRLIATLQQFPKPTEEQMVEHDKWIPGVGFEYTPILPDILDLPGERNTLIIDHRGSFKTTINCEGHTIQWLLNYPTACIGIFQYNLTKAQDTIAGIKHHFVHNDRFRMLFPELCPPADKIHTFGTQTAFDVWGAETRAKSSRKESSVMAAALSAGMAGYHFEVLKFSDIVEPANTETPEQCKKTIHEFGQAQFLLTALDAYWIDLEGTRYSFADLYGKVMDEWIECKKQGIEPPWKVYCRSVFRPNVETPQFTPDELALPDKLDENGKPITWWTKDKVRFNVDKLLYREKVVDPVNFAAQMRNKPIGGRGGVPDFPIVKDGEDYVLPAVISREEFSKIHIAYTLISVDAAYTVSENSNANAFIVADVDRVGRVYVKQIVNEKLESKDVARMIYKLCDTYKPHYLMLEDINFSRGLSMGLEREWDLFPLLHHKPTIKWTKRTNQKAKEEVIRLTLAHYYHFKELRFVKDLIDKKGWEALERELQTFPRGTSDNILDALTDIFYEKQWHGRELPFPSSSPSNLKPEDLINFTPPSEAATNAKLAAAFGLTNTLGTPSTANAFNILTPDDVLNHYRC
jgi:hypothetical protein